VSSSETSGLVTTLAGLRELVGEPLAKELLLAGRVLDADEALAAHLITRVAEPADLLAAGHALADEIAAKDPLATRYTKSIMSSARGEHPRIDLEAQAVLFESPEKRRRMTEFLDRRRK